MSGQSFQQRLSIRCPVCCECYRRDRFGGLLSPLHGWLGWKFRDDPPRLAANPRGRSRGRLLRVLVECKRRRCRHVWWTVMFGPVHRAVRAHGYANDREALAAIEKKSR